MRTSSVLQSALNSSSKVVRFLEGKFDDLELENDNKTMLSFSCFHIVFENQKSVQLLVSNGLFGSAAALLRPMFEACVQGNWLMSCAVDTQIEKFKNKDDLGKKTVEKQITQLEGLPQFSNGWLSNNYDSAYQVMHSLTHPGMQQVVKRYDGSTLKLVFKDAEVIDILKASNTVALFTGLSMANAIDNPVLAKEINGKAKAYDSNNL